MPYKPKLLILAMTATLGLSACSQQQQNTAKETADAPLTAEDAKTFIEDAQKEIQALSHPAAQAAWAYQTYINQDTAAVNPT